MKICIFGAGAIGGFMAAMLARRAADTGTDITVSAVARGPHLAAIRERGLTLDYGGERFTVPLAATDDPAELGPQDYVVVTTKTTGTAAIAPQLASLLHDETTIVTAQNGVPWWYFHGFEGHTDKRLDCVDPGGVIAAAIPPSRVLGCVLHIGASVPEPGVIRHAAQNRFIVGEPDGAESPRATRFVEALGAAGIGAELSRRIQQEIWIKLLGNMSFAPVSILTGATNDEIAGDPGVRQLCIDMIEEAGRIGDAYGLAPGMPAPRRVDLGGELKGFRTSMWQDFEAGRPVELDAIVRSVIEMGALVGVGTPLIGLVYALAAQKAALAGLYRT